MITLTVQQIFSELSFGLQVRQLSCSRLDPSIYQTPLQMASTHDVTFSWSSAQGYIPGLAEV